MSSIQNITHFLYAMWDMFFWKTPVTSDEIVDWWSSFPGASLIPVLKGGSSTLLCEPNQSVSLEQVVGQEELFCFFNSWANGDGDTSKDLKYIWSEFRPGHNLQWTCHISNVKHLHTVPMETSFFKSYLLTNIFYDLRLDSCRNQEKNTLRQKKQNKHNTSDLKFPRILQVSRDESSNSWWLLKNSWKIPLFHRHVRINSTRNPFPGRPEVARRRSLDASVRWRWNEVGPGNFICKE